MRPIAILLLCIACAAVLVPCGMAIWLRSTNSFIGGLTIIGSTTGQPREIAAGWLYIVLGVGAAVVYAVPATLAFLICRRFRSGIRNAVTLAILPVAIGFLWLRVIGRI